MELGRDGAELLPAALPANDLSLLARLARRYTNAGAGVRLKDDDVVSQILAPDGAMQTIAQRYLGIAARPVRAILFDKRPGANWVLGWHQDRTVAVRQRSDVPGFGPWTIKSGINHVEPPFHVIEGMVTLRSHLDKCGNDNAPLAVALGSHKLGRIPIDVIDQVAAKCEQLSCLANPGDVWAYATAMVHASEAVKTPNYRRALQVDYANAPLPGGLDWYELLRSRNSADQTFHSALPSAGRHSYIFP